MLTTVQAGQFYVAYWYIQQPEPRPLPNAAEIQAMLTETCTTSGADMSFEKMNFTISGSDDAVKSALVVISDLNFVAQSPYQIRVKIELANEHKEFVSGKKNGKINKIMGQSMLPPLKCPNPLLMNCCRQCPDHF